MKVRSRRAWNARTAVVGTILGAGIAVEVGIWLGSRGVDISRWGSWLQGVLTPAALLIAALTLWSGRLAAKEQAELQLKAATASEAASRQQVELQLKAAEIAERAAVLSSIETLHAYLDYAATCVVFNKRPSPMSLAGVPEDERGFGYLNWRLFGEAAHAEPVDRQESTTARLTEASWATILRGPYLDIFFAQAASVVELAEAAKVAFLIDPRIKEALGKRQWVSEQRQKLIRVQRPVDLDPVTLEPS